MAYLQKYADCFRYFNINDSCSLSIIEGVEIDNSIYNNYTSYDDNIFLENGLMTVAFEKLKNGNKFEGIKKFYDMFYGNRFFFEEGKYQIFIKALYDDSGSSKTLLSLNLEDEINEKFDIVNKHIINYVKDIYGFLRYVDIFDQFAKGINEDKMMKDFGEDEYEKCYKNIIYTMLTSISYEDFFYRLNENDKYGLIYDPAKYKTSQIMKYIGNFFKDNLSIIKKNKKEDEKYDEIMKTSDNEIIDARNKLSSFIKPKNTDTDSMENDRDFFDYLENFYKKIKLIIRNLKNLSKGSQSNDPISIKNLIDMDELKKIYVSFDFTAKPPKKNYDNNDNKDINDKNKYIMSLFYLILLDPNILTGTYDETNLKNVDDYGNNDTSNVLNSSNTTGITTLDKFNDFLEEYYQKMADISKKCLSKKAILFFCDYKKSIQHKIKDLIIPTMSKDLNKQKEELEKITKIKNIGKVDASKLKASLIELEKISYLTGGASPEINDLVNSLKTLLTAITNSNNVNVTDVDDFLKNSNKLFESIFNKEDPSLNEFKQKYKDCINELKYYSLDTYQMCFLSKYNFPVKNFHDILESSVKNTNVPISKSDFFTDSINDEIEKIQDIEKKSKKFIICIKIYCENIIFYPNNDYDDVTNIFYNHFINYKYSYISTEQNINYEKIIFILTDNQKLFVHSAVEKLTKYFYANNYSSFWFFFILEKIMINVGTVKTIPTEIFIEKDISDNIDFFRKEEYGLNNYDNTFTPEHPNYQKQIYIEELTIYTTFDKYRKTPLVDTLEFYFNFFNFFSNGNQLLFAFKKVIYDNDYSLFYFNKKITYPETNSLITFGNFIQKFFFADDINKFDNFVNIKRDIRGDYVTIYLKDKINIYPDNLYNLISKITLPTLTFPIPNDVAGYNKCINYNIKNREIIEKLSNVLGTNDYFNDVNIIKKGKLSTSIKEGINIYNLENIIIRKGDKMDYVKSGMKLDIYKFNVYEIMTFIIIYHNTPKRSPKHYFRTIPSNNLYNFYSHVLGIAK